MSLLAHYKLNDNADPPSTVVLDASGNGSNGTSIQNTSVLTAAGRINQALTFNGTTDRITIPVTQASGSRTIMAWALANSDTLAARYIMDAQTGRAICGWRGSTGTATLCYYDAGTWRDFGTTPTAASGWRHVAWVCDNVAHTVTCYLDGAVSGSPGTYTATALGGTIVIGGRYTLDTATFSGTIDDFRIYTTALSANAIVAIYYGGTGTEISRPWGARIRKLVSARAA